MHGMHGSLAQRLRTLTLAIVVMVAGAGPAYAGSSYASVGFGVAEYGYSDVESPLVYSFGLGHVVDRRFMVGLRYFGTSTVDVSGPFLAGGEVFNNMQLRTSGLLAMVGYRVHFNAVSNGFVRAGFYRTGVRVRGDSSAGPVAESQSDSGLAVGVGTEWMLADSLALRAVIDLLVDQKDFADDRRFPLFSVGAAWTFAGARR